MRRSASLRWRVVAAATMFGLALSALFALTANWVTEDYEHVLIEEILGAYAEDLAEHLDDGGESGLPSGHALAAWLREADGSGDVPARLATLAPGIHELGGMDEDDEQHVAVYDLGLRRLYVVLGLTSIERREAFLAWVLVGILVLGTVVSSWLGWLFSGRITGPVGRLARAVDDRNLNSGTGELAHQFADDELGLLARAFDRYQQRLLAGFERERAFAAEVSHGLRTPLAVIRGAAEVLMDDRSIGRATRERIDRIDRGAATLADLLDGLLAVARAASPGRTTTENASLVRVVEAVLRDQSSLLCCAGILAVQEGEDCTQLLVAVREAHVALRIVLRTFAESGPPGEMRWSCRGAEVAFRIGAESVRRFNYADLASDRFVGLGLVGRLCIRMGWTLELGEDADGRPVLAKLCFLSGSHT